MQGIAPSLLWLLNMLITVVCTCCTCIASISMFQQTAALHGYPCTDSIVHLFLVQALHSFRDNKSSLLIATPQAARGLDLPAVSHVYNLGPPEDPTEYLHRAGRAGRIGSPVGGVFVNLFVG